MVEEYLFLKVQSSYIGNQTKPNDVLLIYVIKLIFEDKPSWKQEYRQGSFLVLFWNYVRYPSILYSSNVFLRSFSWRDGYDYREQKAYCSYPFWNHPSKFNRNSKKDFIRILGTFEKDLMVHVLLIKETLDKRWVLRNLEKRSTDWGILKEKRESIFLNFWAKIYVISLQLYCAL